MEYKTAQTIMQEALHIVRHKKLQTDSTYANILSDLGLISTVLGEHDQAITQLQQALTLWRKIGNRYKEAQVLLKLGIATDVLGLYQEAYTYYEESLQLRREISDQRGQAVALHNIGDVAFVLGRYREAETYYQEALAIRRGYTTILGQIPILNDLGKLYAATGNDAQAEAYYQTVLAWYRESGTYQHGLKSLAGLAKLALQRGNLKQAYAYMADILPYIEEDPTLTGIHTPLSIYLTCIQVAQALHQEKRVINLLQIACRVLHEQAIKIKDKKRHRSFLENVAEHQQIIQLYREKGLAEPEGKIGSQAMDLGDIQDETPETAVSFNNQSSPTTTQATATESPPQPHLSPSFLEDLSENEIQTLNQAKDVHQLATILSQWGHQELQQSNYNKARKYLERGLHLFTQLQDSAGMADTLSRLGRIHIETGAFNLAQEKLHQSLKRAQQSQTQSLIIYSLCQLGDLAYRQGQYSQAQQHYEQALPLAQEENNLNRMALTLNGLGNVCTALKAYIQAEHYHQRNLEICRQIGKPFGIARAYNNLGEVARKQGNYLQAREYFGQAASQVQKDTGPTSFPLAVFLNNQGYASIPLGEHKTALHYFQRSLQISTTLKSEYAIAYSIMGFAWVAAKEKQHQRALELLGLVLNHPAVGEDYRNDAEPALYLLRNTLPLDAIEAGLKQGQTLNLTETAQTLLQLTIDN